MSGTTPAATVALTLLTILASPLAAQETQISFTTTEGTWVSLDVAPDGGSLVFELLGDVYSLPVEGGRARPLLTGRAFQSQPRFSPAGRLLAYVSDESGSDNVWIAATDGSMPRRLTDKVGATMLSPAWSVDGSAIYVTVIASQDFSSFAEIWRFNVESGAGERVVENENGPSQPLVSAPAPGPYGAAPHPNGSDLYYTSLTPRPYGSRNGASSRVIRLSQESGRAEPVLLESPIAMKPAVTPDGRRLVYGAVRDGRTGLKVRELDTGDERWLAYPIQRNQLESRATRDVLPNFGITPDSRALFAAWNGRIHRIDLDDGTDRVVPFEVDVSLAVTPKLDFPRRVEQGPVRARRVQQLAVSSDGRAAFSALGRIWLAGLRGAEARRLTASVRPREFMPAWSADGRWVSFVTWDESGGHLWKAQADGSGEPIRVSDSAALWADPAWTPDGTSIVALRAPLGSALAVSGPGQGAVPPDAEVVVVPSEGGTPRRLMAADGGRRPHFGPSSDRVYLAGPTLISVALDGSDRRLEARLGPDDGLGELRLSPNGTHVIATGGPATRLFTTPSQGLDGSELTSPVPMAVVADRPGLVAWSGDGGSVSAIAGVRLQTLRVSTPSASPLAVELDVSLPRATPAGAVVLRGATVVTMNGYEVVENADVVVEGNRILGVGPTGSIDVPVGATEIDMSGKYVVPGFIDVHAHFATSGELPEPESTVSFANLAYGVTTLRNPQGTPDVFGLSDMVAVDGVPAPRVFSTGPGLFSQGTFTSPDEARSVIEPYRDGFGTHLLKWYMAGPRSERQALIQAARKLEMMPTTEGGADTKADLTYAMDGFSGLEHAFPVAPIHDDLVQLVARTGITYTPTVVVAFGGALPVYRLLAEERPHENAKLSRWFADGSLYARSSSRVLWFPPEDYNDQEVAAGADAILGAGGRVALGGHGEAQGLSNHWEMGLLARGGMSNHDVLRVATLFGAEAIGYAQDLGSVEPGKLADLVVLDRNPLEDIAATQAIAYVMKNGVVYRGETLDEVWPRQRPLPMPWSLRRADEPGAVVSEIEDLVRSTMDNGRIPGIALAVVRKGEVLLAKGFGIANLETDASVTTESLFQSGSLGKQFTSAGIMALVEDGLLDLDGSVTEYLPEAPETWQPITIHHLLTHSSGIPDYTSEGFDYQTNYTEEDLVRMASGLDLEFPAGDRWNYSNTGYAMLGVVMSRVAGMPYWDFLRERIFDPAGMPTIRINTESDVVPHRARGYLPVAGGWQNAGYVAPMTNTTADGSMLLNLHDMIAWNDVVANRRLLSERSWDLILNPMTLNSGRNYPYGFGWFLEEAGGQTVRQHGGNWQGFSTQFTRFVDDDLAVIVLANARSLPVAGLPNGIGALLNPSLAPAPPPSTRIADPDPEATEYVGEMLAKIARGELVLDDFAFIRQTVFPRIRAAMTAQLQGMGEPDRMELLARHPVGDDVSLQYWAWYGDQRFRVLVSLGPGGGLTSLRLITEAP